jgi:cytochrome P450
VDLAYSTLLKFMREQVASRKADIHGQAFSDIKAPNGLGDRRHDIFSRLVAASESEVGKPPLDDSELIGNTFLMLIAGHGDRNILLKLKTRADRWY